MKKTLRKTSLHIHITYQHGGYSNNLWAQDATAEMVDGSIVFTLDLGLNFRVRNKESNQYLDAIELAESTAKLQFIQMDDDQTLSGLGQIWKDSGAPPIKIALALGDYGVVRYSVKVEPKERYVQFDVTKFIS